MYLDKIPREPDKYICDTTQKIFLSPSAFYRHVRHCGSCHLTKDLSIGKRTFTPGFRGKRPRTEPPDIEDEATQPDIDSTIHGANERDSDSQQLRNELHNANQQNQRLEKELEVTRQQLQQLRLQQSSEQQCGDENINESRQVVLSQQETDIAVSPRRQQDPQDATLPETARVMPEEQQVSPHHISLPQPAQDDVLRGQALILRPLLSSHPLQQVVQERYPLASALMCKLEISDPHDVQNLVSRLFQGVQYPLSIQVTWEPFDLNLFGCIQIPVGGYTAYSAQQQELHPLASTLKYALRVSKPDDVHDLVSRLIEGIRCPLSIQAVLQTHDLSLSGSIQIPIVGLAAFDLTSCWPDSAMVYPYF